jgi:hypothetical protein
MITIRSVALWLLAVAALSGGAAAMHLQALATVDTAQHRGTQTVAEKPITMGIRN